MNNQHKNTTTNKLLRITLLVFSILSGVSAFAQKPDKVQQAIDGIKAANYSEDQEYHTDGQRVVWVKSYKQWLPGDFNVMKKEAPDILSFLSKAIQHKRFDVLEQLLPNYYRAHGGTKAFAADVMKHTKLPTKKGR